MAKQPKLNYDQVETLYLSGYNTKEIAMLLGSVNGHISKVLRHLGVAMRKRGEVVDKVAFVNMDSDAQTLLRPIRVQMDDMYDAWVRSPRRASVMAKPSPKPRKVTKPKAVVEVNMEANTEAVMEANTEAVIEVLEIMEVAPEDAPNSLDELLDEMDSMAECAVSVEPVADVLADATEVTEDGTVIVRGEDFKRAELAVQGKIIAHYMSKGMAQRPIAKELGVAQSSISKTWSKYKKAVN